MIGLDVIASLPPAITRSAALGEAVLFLAAHEIDLTLPRIIFVREEIAAVAERGVDGPEAPLDTELTASEPAPVMAQLRRSAVYGLLTAARKHAGDRAHQRSSGTRVEISTTSKAPLLGVALCL